jgi:hypothetical protein
MLHFFAAPRLALNPDPHFLDGFLCRESEVYFNAANGSQKSFTNDIEEFWKKIQDESGVKNCRLSEGASSSFCNSAKGVLNPKIAYRGE